VSTTTPVRPYRKQAWERNRCAVCGRFQPWPRLVLHFVPDSECSSEAESWRECADCLNRRTNTRLGQ
jgi:hypothetical protein